ncbi:hypothetical protein MUU48_03255 [Scandinavium sp. H11S7]|uniref:hypothetical protein n=1 Tax=Scandinavium hiltneri TaxID=2926519 RepID=UPI002165FA45|nr:hypothetical protein [Scandinavium hiltneri]MCS2155959.1 hypothetical protein [Scandinavium hiltneri]
MGNGSFKKKALPILNDAMFYARSRLPLKSTNKFYPDKRVIDKWKIKDPKRYSLHTESMDTEKIKKLNELRALRMNPAQYCQRLDSDFNRGIKNAGNCGENAMLAFSYLNKHVSELQRHAKDPVRILRIYLDMPVDHCLVLVGTFPDKGSAQLLENTLICDPWTKIVCPLNIYTSLWKAKMKKWSGRGLKGVHGGQTYDFYEDLCTRYSIYAGRVRIDEEAMHGIAMPVNDNVRYSLMNRKVFS